MSDHQSDERPEPDRTVIVEEAHLLADQIEHSEQEYEAVDNDAKEAYHRTWVKEAQEYKRQIEGDGLREQRVREIVEDAAEEVSEADDGTPAEARAAGKLDAARQVLGRYFGDENGRIDLGDIAGSKVDDDIITLDGTKNRVEFTISEEGMARATADTILQAAGVDAESAHSVGGRI